MNLANRPLSKLQFTRLNLPTQLTVIRLVLVPIFVAAFLLPMDNRKEIVAGIFAIACITDFLDGYLARRWGQTTAFGAFLDPIADKLIVVAALFILLWEHANIWLTIPALIIITRELCVSALRELLATLHVGRLVKVSWLGKCKTTLQMIALFALLLHSPQYSKLFTYVGYVSLYIAAIITIWSMAQYLALAWPVIIKVANPRTST